MIYEEAKRFPLHRVPLNTTFIKELHMKFCGHQWYSPFMNGDKVLFLLLFCFGLFCFFNFLFFDNQQEYTYTRPGKWKPYTNQAGGTVFCPPNMIDSEMEKFLSQLEIYQKDHVIAPEVLAAWVHHQFVLIHPFIVCFNVFLLSFLSKVQSYSSVFHQIKGWEWESHKIACKFDSHATWVVALLGHFAWKKTIFECHYCGMMRKQYRYPLYSF